MVAENGFLSCFCYHKEIYFFSVLFFLFRAPTKMPSLSDQRWALMPFSPVLGGTGLIQEDAILDFPVFLNFSSFLPLPAAGDS